MYIFIILYKWRLKMVATDWKKRVKDLLKGELKRKGITYEELAKRLTEIGIDENTHNIGIKLHRGTFSAMFMIQCLDVIRCQDLRLGD